MRKFRLPEWTIRLLLCVLASADPEVSKHVGGLFQMTMGYLVLARTLGGIGRFIIGCLYIITT